MDTLRYMFDTCTAFVRNIYQLCSLKLKKKKKNVNLGCLKTLTLCAQ